MAATKSTQQHTGRTTAKANTGAPGTVTSASAWKKQTVQGTPLRVPSGNTCLVRAPGMEVFLREGVIPNGLMGIIQEAMPKGGGNVPDDAVLESLVADQEKLAQIVQLADAVTIYCCIEPKVEPAPMIPNPRWAEDSLDPRLIVAPMGHPSRSDDVLYVDEVDFADKMYIFNFAVGGTADLERFRSE